MRSSAVALFIALALVKTAVAAPPCDLTGSWSCRGKCQVLDGSDHISQDGSAINFTGETGEVTHGYWEDPFTIVKVIDSQKGTQLRGHVSKDCTRIDWKNPTYWIRKR